MIADLAIEIVDPGHPDALKLIGELDAYQNSIYPEESNHLDSIEELRADHVRFMGAFHDLDMVACGAIKLFADYAEVKRIYVPPPLRGRVIGRAMIRALEAQAMKHGRHTARIETGVYQPEALALYQIMGYQKCEAFGDYPNDPMSVFMQKALVPPI
ncbi:MAG: GNAT family N-acetyltransferase [Pseudomonadota bacterium]